MSYRRQRALFSFPSHTRTAIAAEHQPLSFPEGNPFPFKCGVDHPYKTWADVHKALEAGAGLPNFTGWRRFRRICWVVVTFGGFLGSVTGALYELMRAIFALILSQIWFQFLNNHMQGLFNDGTADLPYAWNQFFYCVLVTVGAGVLIVFSNGGPMYYRKFFLDSRLVFNLELFNMYNAQARTIEENMDTHAEGYDWTTDPMAFYLRCRIIDHRCSNDCMDNPATCPWGGEHRCSAECKWDPSSCAAKRR
jgi:hypothetical protein